MRSTSKQPSSQESVDRKMLLLLKRKGAQTIEGLIGLTGACWEQVFFSVDRLSRTGKVSLTLIRPCEYRVSVAQPVR
jgi:hypothetical protein